MMSRSILNNAEILIEQDKENKVCYNFPNSLGYVELEKSIINKDIFLIKNDIVLNKDTTLEASSKEEGLCISVTLNGRLSYKDQILNEKIDKQKNSMFVKYMNSSHSFYESKKNETIKEIGLVIKGDFLKKHFLEKLNDVDNVQKKYDENIPTVLKKSRTNMKTAILANEIYNSPFKGDLNNLFLQSKVYEIIYNEFSDILEKNSSNVKEEIKFSTDDLEALYKAKALICEEKDFLSLPELSKKVALNEFKLKYGFKKFFNTSPGNMILEYRLQEAKKLLESTELNISEISSLVGYKYVQSFSTAFKKRFNVNPKDVMIKRKYYF